MKKAHSSAPAASWIHLGGIPLPNPTRVPSTRVTTSAKPVRRANRRGSSNNEPSMYQTAFSGTRSGGDNIQVKVPPSGGKGARTFRVKRPRVDKNSLRHVCKPLRTLLHSGGGGSQPSKGRIALQVRRCEKMPTASKHNWHRLSSVHPGTEDILGIAVQILIFLDWSCPACIQSPLDLSLRCIVWLLWLHQL